MNEEFSLGQASRGVAVYARLEPGRLTQRAPEIANESTVVRVQSHYRRTGGDQLSFAALCRIAEKSVMPDWLADEDTEGL